MWQTSSLVDYLYNYQHTDKGRPKTITLRSEIHNSYISIRYQLFFFQSTTPRLTFSHIYIRSVSFFWQQAEPFNSLRHNPNQSVNPIEWFFHYQIYKHNMHGRKYAWVVHTPDKDGWWRRTFANVNCTPEEVNEGAKGTLLVNYMWLSSSKNQTVSGMVGRYTAILMYRE